MQSGRSTTELNALTPKVRWPSGLRRYVQVVVSSGAWVRTPPSPHFALPARRGPGFLFAGNRGLTVRILAFQASGPGSTPGGCTFPEHTMGGTPAKEHPWQDSNLQPPDPWSGALPLSHTDSCRQPCRQPWSSGMMEPSQGFDPGSIPGGCTFLQEFMIRSRVAQWSARWAHNPQVVGSKPTSAIVFCHRNQSGLSRESNPGPLAPKARIMPLDH